MTRYNPPMSDASPAPESRPARLALALGVWGAAAAYARYYLLRPLVPNDSGLLGQCAERVLQGELPHRDFDAVYTGGLACLNGLAFALVGPSVAAQRGVVFVAFLAWVPAVYALARRVSAPAYAALATALCVVWSLPNYPEAMPSWFNLFLATWGALALVEHARSGAARWALLAGVCAGASLLIKIVGLYFLAALLLVLLAREQATARARPAAELGQATRGYTWFLVLGLCLFVTAVARLTWGSPARAVHYTLPAAALVAALVAGELPLWQRPRACRFVALARLAAPALGGVALVVLPWLLVYAVAGALGDLYHGLFVLPQRRLNALGMPLPPLLLSAGLVVVWLAVWAGERVPARWRPGLWGLAAALPLVTAFGGDHVPTYRLVFDMIRFTVPLVVVVGCGWLIRATVQPAAVEPATVDPAAAEPAAVEPERQATLFVLLACAACCSLVQFPFAHAFYFFYVAPLGVLAALALATRRGQSPNPLFCGALVACLVFSARWVIPGSISELGNAYAPSPHTAYLDLPRAGVYAKPGERDQYVELVGILAALEAGRDGRADVYALPDSPEVYFLAGLRNPTRTLYDFFESPTLPPLLTRCEQLGVRIVVVNHFPDWSPRVPELELRALRREFPEQALVGRFEVRWR